VGSRGWTGRVSRQEKERGSHQGQAPKAPTNRPYGELCAKHEISQAQYYQWRDQFLANAAKAFEPAGAKPREKNVCGE
jgi:transposase-like protein